MRVDVLVLLGAEVSPPYLLRSVAYRDIDGDPKSLMKLIDGAEDNAGASAALEEQYRRQGLSEEAKQVHILRRKGERKGLGWSHPFRYACNLTEDVVAGYGQRLTRALLWGVAVIALGWVVFRRAEWMETQKPEDAT
jgi:hypothetical protein